MAKRTIESGSCLNEKPHGEHKFRPGIFGLGRKVLCKGIPKTNFDSLLITYCEEDVKATSAFYEKMFGITEVEHRHYYGFYPEKSDRIIMVWRCLDPFCDKEYSRFRSLFNYQTRVRRTLEDGYSVRYSEDFMRSWQ